MKNLYEHLIKTNIKYIDKSNREKTQEWLDANNIRKECYRWNKRGLLTCGVGDDLLSYGGIFYKFNGEEIPKYVIDTIDFTDRNICYGLFYNCVNLKKIHGLANKDISKTNTVYAMFFNCKNLEEDLSNLKIPKNIGGIDYMFAGCRLQEKNRPQII